MAGFAKTWACQTRFTPDMDSKTRQDKYAGWTRAVQATLSA
jgi:glycerol kinase